MENVLIYILQVNILLSFVYLGYVFLLKGLTFYKLNRVYFLLGSVYTVLFPFVDLGGWFRRSANVSVPLALEYIPFDIAGEPTAQFTLDRLLLGIVVLAGVVFLFRLIVQLLSLGRIHIHSQPAEWKGYLFRNVLFPIVPFSFFRKIYIHEAQHEEPELHDIFKHEAVHVKGLHSMDVLWFEMLLIGCWYNPFVWLMRRAVRQNLEYLTDQQVLDKGMDRQTYQYSLLHVTQQGAAVGMGNHFNFRSLKRRIIMMNKRRSSRLELGKYAFLLPVLILAGASFTVSKAERKIEEVVVVAKETELDGVVRTLEKVVTGTAISEKTDISLSKETVAEKQGNDIEFLLDGRWVDKEVIANLDVKEIESIVINGNNALTKPYGKETTLLNVKTKKFAGTVGTPSRFKSISIHDDGKISVDGPLSGHIAARDTTKVIEGKPLKGAVKGVQITKESLGSQEFSIKGLKGNPLIIVDGVKKPKDYNMNSLDPNDIGSISVLKDTTGTAVYGEAGKEGVIIFTTKSAHKNKEIVVRGYSSGSDTSSGKSLPKNVLYIIDGTEGAKDALSKLDPNNIESITVLKDGNARAVYGEKGKDGVVLITTKKGKGLTDELISDEVKLGTAYSDDDVYLVDGNAVSKNAFKAVPKDKIKSVQTEGSKDKKGVRREITTKK